MTNTNDDVLRDIARLKEASQKYMAQIQDAKVKEQVLTEKLEALALERSKLAGDISWDDLDSVISEAQLASQKAVESLADALTEAGVEYQ